MTPSAVVEFECRVYEDGRLRLPPEVLQTYADLARKAELPQSIWLTKTSPTGGAGSQLMLTWVEMPDSEKYDLSGSARDLFLFGQFEPGTVVAVNVSPVSIWLFYRFPKCPPIPEPGHPPVVRTFTLAKFKREFKRATRREIVRIVRERYASVTLAELGAVMPDLTIAELIAE